MQLFRNSLGRQVKIYNWVGPNSCVHYHKVHLVSKLLPAYKAFSENRVIHLSTLYIKAHTHTHKRLLSTHSAG